MKMKLSVAIALLVSISGLTSAQVSDVNVPVPNGTFVFQGLKVTKCGKAVCIKGTVTNNTPVQWGMISFGVTLFDKAGRRLIFPSGDLAEFPIFDVMRGTATKLDEKLYSDIKGDIGRFELVYDVGIYPASYVFSLVKPTVNKSLAHDDEFIKATFSIASNPQNNPIGLMVTNKTASPMVIDWNQVSFVDERGSAHKVVHKGTRLMDKDQPIPPTTIPPGATVDDFVFPSDRVEMLSGKWIQQMLFPDAPKAGLLKGKQFSVFIPIEINGTKRNYNFTFSIDDVIM